MEFIQPQQNFNFFQAGGFRPPVPPLKVGHIRGLRNDGPVRGPWPRPMALAHWSRVRPWSMGPGLGPGPAHGPLGPGPALVHGPRPGPGSGPGPWAPAHGPGRAKKKCLLFSCKKKVFTFFLDFISTVPGSVEMKSPPNGGHSISTFPGNVQI